jgi:Na+-transporting NADH:ubiquinone oxidoreductase subunit NqrC
MSSGARILTRLTLSLVAACFVAGAAQAQSSCQDDFQRLTKRRMDAIATLNNHAKSHKGKMDPMAACPMARHLAGVETEMMNYMTKNKEWCAIPDNVIDGFKQARAKTMGFASQACSDAVKFQKMKEQAIRQQKAAAAHAADNPGGMAPQKLPAGPL